MTSRLYETAAHGIETGRTTPSAQARPTAAAAALAALLAVLVPPPASAHGEAHGSGASARAPAMVETDFGRTGDPRAVARTIRVDMNDRMRFAPEVVRVKVGETVRFEVTNSGKVLHEMVIGTEAELAKHAELMRKHPGMEHDEPYMVHVGPGRQGAMVWQFTKAGSFHYGCLVPGHFEAGMKGRIEVVR